jgi:hypothetical protein
VGSWRRAVPLVVLAVAILAVAAVTGRQDPGDGPPLDPTSTGPLGTAALVETLRAVGAQVDIAPTVPDRLGPVVLVLADGLDSAQHDELADWVEAGGTLVVTDPRSALAPAPSDDAGGFLPGAILRRECDAAALAAVAVVDAPGAVGLSTPEGALACFPRGEGHWLVAQRSGQGAVVAVGGPEVWTNRRIGSADNALLAAALLAPTEEAGVHVLRPTRPGEGTGGLADVLDPRVPAALVQVALAFLLFVAWRARRLGAPPAEPRQVTIPAAELVVAAGNLYQQAGARAHAAALLRDDLRASLRRRLGLPAAAGDEALAAAASRTRGADPTELLRVLGAPDPSDDRSLTAFARDAERARRAVAENEGADHAG